MKSKGKRRSDILNEFEEAVKKADKRFYVLRLYLTGSTPKSAIAVEAVKNFCEQYLSGRYELEVVDLYQQPERAKESQVIVAPTLVKELPLPIRRLVGDLSKTEQVLIALSIKP